VSTAAPYPLRFQIGARTLLTARRRLVRVPISLDEVLSGEAPRLPPIERADHGYVLNSLPEALVPTLAGVARGLRPFVRQRYTRYFADLDGGFDAYLAGFSARSRATLLRKSRRFAERSGGAIDIRACRTPAEVESFFDHARAVSRRSYQERLLDAGLPEGGRAEMLALAARDALRAFLLFLDGEPVSYLYLPARGDMLVYAYLGYDAAHADLSPGAVLQLEAMRLLMAEGRFRRLDFTEGEGQHKRVFATGGVACVDLLLLRPSLANLGWVAALDAFDGAVAGAKALLDRPGLRPIAKTLRR
jgi:CelD/BcsL family acetyltransferase involved in cellulose biosynthesis